MSLRFLMKYGVLFFALLFHSLTAAQTSLQITNITRSIGFSQVLNDPKNTDVFYGLNTNPNSLYQSHDGGLTWQALRNPLSDVSIQKIVLSPDGKTLYALLSSSLPSDVLNNALVNSNIFKSIDQGDTWQALTDNYMCTGSSIAFSSEYLSLHPLDKNCLVFINLIIDPITPTTLYAINSNSSLDNYMTGSRIKKSVDGGKTWFESSAGIPINYFLDMNEALLVIDPKNPQRLYFINSTLFDGLQDVFYVTENGGKTWQKLENDLPKRLNTDNMFVVDKLWVHPNSPNVLYLRTRQYIPVEISTYDGISEYNLTAPQTFYSNSFRSLDYGKTWTDITFGKLAPLNNLSGHIIDHIIFAVPPDISWIYGGIIGFDPQNPEVIYSRVTRGSGRSDWENPGDQYEFKRYLWSYLYRSADGGKTWQQTNFEGDGAISTDLIIQEQERLTVITSNNLYKKSGDNWQYLDTEPRTAMYYHDMIPDSHPDSFYFNTGYDIFYSTDAGKTQTHIMSPTTPLGFDSLLSFVGKNQQDDLYVRTGDNNLYKTFDKGLTWQNIALPPDKVSHADSDKFMINPITQAVYILQCYPLFRFYQSLDDGKNWQLLLDIPNSESSNSTAEILIDPMNAQRLYVTCGDLYHQTVDDGNSWRIMPAVVDNKVVSRLTLSNDGKSLYTYIDDMVYRSDNQGDSWQVLGVFPTWNKISNKLYAIDNVLFSVSNTAIYRSTDQGKSWQWVYTSDNGVITQVLFISAERFYITLNPYSRLLTLQTSLADNTLNAITITPQRDFYLQNATLDILVNQQVAQKLTLKAFDETQITARIQPVLEHQGQAAELLVLLHFQPKDTTQNYWLMQTPSGTWQIWDGSLDTLKPAKTIQALQAIETANIFTGKLAGVVGTSTIYTGYRLLSKDDITYNRNTPLVLTVE